MSLSKQSTSSRPAVGATMTTRRETTAGLLVGAALAAAPTIAPAKAANAMVLPPPRSKGGQPLITALKLRRSIREYADRPLPQQLLSDLLWAAFGINRPNADRTAPYWRHIMVMDIYAATANGVWRYEPKDHTLLAHLNDDIRAQTGVHLRRAWRTHGGCRCRGSPALRLG
jgi:hypothetical protein